MEELVQWKNSKNRKPLIIRGARQVGKTWLMKEFGKKIMKNMLISILRIIVECNNYFKEI